MRSGSFLGLEKLEIMKYKLSKKEILPGAVDKKYRVVYDVGRVCDRDVAHRLKNVFVFLLF